MATRTAQRSPERQNQMKIFGIFGAIAVIAAIGLIIWSQSESNKSFEIDDARFSAYAGIPLDESIEESNRDVTEKDDIADGVVQGILEDGTPFIGSLDAPIVLAEFSDFSCPHCADYEPEVEQLIRQYVRSGQLRFEYRAMTFVGGEFSRTAASGAICAAEQGAFWEFHSELFRYQSTQGANYFTTDNVVDIAKDLGLDDSKLRGCMNSPRPDRALRAASQLQNEMGVSSTPTVIYRANDSETWSRFYDASGQPTTRGSFSEIGQLIASFNTPAVDDTINE